MGDKAKHRMDGLGDAVAKYNGMRENTVCMVCHKSLLTSYGWQGMLLPHWECQNLIHSEFQYMCHLDVMTQSPQKKNAQCPKCRGEWSPII